jgi:hypothetical protein
MIVPLRKWGFTYDTETGRYTINLDEVPLSSITEYWLDDRRPKEEKNIPDGIYKVNLQKQKGKEKFILEKTKDDSNEHE